MSDLVKRLREIDHYIDTFVDASGITHITNERKSQTIRAAADEIERLEREVEALKKYWFDDADPYETEFDKEYGEYWMQARDAAKEGKRRMSDTPRTNNLAWTTFFGTEIVEAELARQLEREVEALKAELADCMDAFTDDNHSLGVALHENEALRAEVQKLKSQNASLWFHDEDAVIDAARSNSATDSDK